MGATSLRQLNLISMFPIWRLPCGRPRSCNASNAWVQTIKAKQRRAKMMSRLENLPRILPRVLPWESASPAVLNHWAAEPAKYFVFEMSTDFQWTYLVSFGTAVFPKIVLAWVRPMKRVSEASPLLESARINCLSIQGWIWWGHLEIVRIPLSVATITSGFSMCGCCNSLWWLESSWPLSVGP